MRQCTIAIVGAVALSIAVPDTANARPRFGPGMIFGAFGAILGGLRPAIGHRSGRESTGSRENSGSRETGRASTRATGDEDAVERRPVVANRAVATRHIGWRGPVFWPHASDDIVDYALFPSAADNRFWAYGFGDILDGVFAPSVGRGGAVVAATDNDAASEAKASAVEADVCGGAAASGGADRVIERIEQALHPGAAKDGTLAALRTALVRAGDTIKAACRTAMPATPSERLDAMLERIWAMRDATLTIRIPLETFYQSLTDEQKARLDGSDWALMGIAVEATDDRAGAQPRMCGEPAPALMEWPKRAIERVLRPSEQQRASLEELRMRLMGMAQLIMSSCPAPSSATPLGRLAATMDRLDVMLFAVMSLGPAVQQFYDSLGDKQKADLHKVMLQQARRAGGDS